MNKSAPLKRHPAIVSFSKDHHFGLLLVWKIRQGMRKEIDPQRISAYVLYFSKADLETHFKDEEQELFSRLPQEDALRQQAEADHLAIRQLLTSIESQRDNLQLLSQLADQLEKHIRFEERELFNHLQQQLGAGELEKIEQRIATSGNVIDEQWDDCFWEEKS